MAVLETPLLAQHLFREVVHCSLVTLCLLPTVGLDQVQASTTTTFRARRPRHVTVASGSIVLSLR